MEATWGHKASVAIITPAYNAAAFLTETLDSVLAQTFTDWCLLVVDDGSRDETAGIASGYAQRDARFCVVTCPNGGVARARNRGIAQIPSHVQYVALLDHDDLWELDTLAILTQLLEAHPNAPAAHGMARKYTDTVLGELMDPRRRRLLPGGLRAQNCKPDEPTSFEVLAYDSCLCTPGVALVRREAALGITPLAEEGPFDSTVAPGDDWDFWLRLTARYGPMPFTNQPVLRWRVHGGNASSDGAKMLMRQSDIRRKMLTDPNLSPTQHKTMYGRYRRMIASEWRKAARTAIANGPLAQAARLQARSLQARLFWGKVQDRGPIPWSGLSNTS